MSIKLDKTSKLYDSKIVIDKISLEIFSGEILGLVGPNGAGKTTLLNLMAGDYSSFSGQIYYENIPLNKHTFLERAMYRSVMSQSQEIIFDFTVKEIIEMGIVGGFGIDYGKKTWNNFQEVIEVLELEKFLNRSIRKLSGGERQRVHIARSLIQIWNSSEYTKPKFLLLDEPTSNLDLRQEIKFLDFIKNETKKGLGVMIIFHDLNLTAHYADKVAILSNGKIFKWGVPLEVLTPISLKNVYDVDMSVTTKPFRIFHF
tara:strand:+ start:29 stop:802 length:774 start_codon:yes stop_codon:yes gene_type:complete